jgi:hypothetical protein
MVLGPELYEIEGLFTKIVIKPTETYIICKKPILVIEVLEKYDVGCSQNYCIFNEDEAIRRGI